MYVNNEHRKAKAIQQIFEEHYSKALTELWERDLVPFVD
jgi:hypothetical protein